MLIFKYSLKNFYYVELYIVYFKINKCGKSIDYKIKGINSLINWMRVCLLIIRNNYVILLVKEVYFFVFMIGR